MPYACLPALSSLCPCVHVLLDMGLTVTGVGLTVLEVGLTKLKVDFTGCDVEETVLLVVGRIVTILLALPAEFTATTLME